MATFEAKAVSRLFYFETEVSTLMNYKRFEDLPVWNAAIELAVEIYALTESAPFRRRRSLRDQIERAAVSVSNNIAETPRPAATKKRKSPVQ
jgi:hypothetical protein